MIYFIQAGDDGPVKIGFTSSWGLRLSTLQIGNHAELRVRALMAGDREDERVLHARFAAHLVRGEWYEPTADILAMCKDVGLSALDTAIGTGKSRLATMVEQDTLDAIRAIAQQETRSESAMANILIQEALAARTRKTKAA